jgi:hypothetical protein
MTDTESEFFSFLHRQFYFFCSVFFNIDHEIYTKQNAVNSQLLIFYFFRVY